MQHNLEEAYIPTCVKCQHNKSSTTKSISPLHPLPIPDKCCNSVTIDFIGPLLLDHGFDCIITFTDHLGSDIQLIPTTTTLKANKLAELFFKEWYCKNGLPLKIISDHDKLFNSHFWHALHKLTGVKLKMSTAYHPQTDSTSKQTNKTVIQCIRFAIEQHQKGWVQALNKICFNMMNTVNSSTSFTPFQLQFRKSPQLLPPLLEEEANPEDEPSATEMITWMKSFENTAQDNLLTAKIRQASQANKQRKLTFPFHVGDKVSLSTFHQQQEYKAGEEPHVAKFLPCYDGPY